MITAYDDWLPVTRACHWIPMVTVKDVPNMKLPLKASTSPCLEPHIQRCHVNVPFAVIAGSQHTVALAVAGQPSEGTVCADMYD